MRNVQNQICAAPLAALTIGPDYRLVGDALLHYLSAHVPEAGQLALCGFASFVSVAIVGILI